MSVNNALITGINGFCGRHLTAALARVGFTVVGIDQISPSCHIGAVVYVGDIRDKHFLRHVIGATQPQVIIHLAALTALTANSDMLDEVNIRGTRYLLETVQESGLLTTILIASSSATYGKVAPDELPIREIQPFRPFTAYAISKIAQEMLGYQFYAAHGARVIITRTFNLTGPGENEHFVTSTFAHQIAEIEAGKRAPIINVGNLDAVRDFTDVRDAMRAYVLLAQQGTPGTVYNVCSGQGTRIRKVLDLLLELSAYPDIKAQLDPARLQPADVPIQIGSAERLNALTGWTPTRSMRETLNDVLNFWRQRVHEE